MNWCRSDLVLMSTHGMEALMLFGVRRQAVLFVTEDKSMLLYYA
jgi:hypothetical protein